MQTGTRVLLTVFVVFTLLAVNQLLVLGDHTDRFFAWTIMSVPNGPSSVRPTPPEPCCPCWPSSDAMEPRPRACPHGDGLHRAHSGSDPPATGTSCT